ncbi:MAG: rRNA processing protein RimM [Chloroflexi bacterium]|nr:rRNA processing protein RimM [Chloroflexota bacterium]MDB5077532.1 rRNA processing protein RimM [Chloroflexota bacterium]
MLVGIIAGAFGVRGELKVQLLTDFPDRFQKLATIYAGEDRRPMAVLGARPIGERVALRLAEVPDRDAAQALFDTRLYVPRSEVMPLPEGRFYHDQIIGLQAVTTEGQTLGTIVEILQTGSNDVYVAREGSTEVLIPAIKDVVREIDVQGGRLVVEPIEGLL